jgi:hypothetical protein
VKPDGLEGIMKFGVISLSLLLAAGTVHGQRNNRNETDAVNRACGVQDCFREDDVRDFEVIDRTDLIVYVGSQRCAFHISLSGALCDLSFAPELYFRSLNEVPQVMTSPVADPRAAGSGARAGGDFNAFAIEERGRRGLLICGNDLMIQVHGGVWTESQTSGTTTDRFGNPRSDCRISNVTSVTDDQLLEFYVGRGVLAPVPPMGTGEIEVGEQEEEERTAPADRGREDSDD